MADTDTDGLLDGVEVNNLQINPIRVDTDGDCIPDGIELLASGKTTPDISYIAGVHTNPASSDTDEDGLPDGKIAGIGEDMDCNGQVTLDDRGVRIETDPRSQDTDLDGENDRAEMTKGGFFNIANVKRSVSGKQGCLSVAGTSPTDPASMLYVFGLILLVNRVMATKTRDCRGRRAASQ